MIKPVIVKQIDSVSIKRYLRENNIDVDLYGMCGDCNNGETWNLELLIHPTELDLAIESEKVLYDVITQAPYKSPGEYEWWDHSELQVFFSWMKYHGHLDCGYSENLQFHVWW